MQDETRRERPVYSSTTATYYSRETSTAWGLSMDLTKSLGRLNFESIRRLGDGESIFPKSLPVSIVSMVSSRARFDLMYQFQLVPSVISASFVGLVRKNVVRYLTRAAKRYYPWFVLTPPCAAVSMPRSRAQFVVRIKIIEFLIFPPMVQFLSVRLLRISERPIESLP